MMKFTRIERLLCGVFLLALAVIAAVSFWALVLRPSAAARSAVTLKELETEGTVKMFAGIGRLRAPLGTESKIAVVSPVFPYNSADRAFTEELAAHLRDFRRVTLEYFALLPADAPELINEHTLKNDLLNRYNALLKLGKIEELYLTDYMIIE